jgi:hypothetical protein
LWGKGRDIPTCLASNSRVKTRRGYVFITPNLLPAITDYDVIDDGSFSVHPRVAITCTTGPTFYKALGFEMFPPIIAPPTILDIDYKEWASIWQGHQTDIIRQTRQLARHQIENKNTTALWELISCNSECGTLTASELTEINGNQGRGRIRDRTENNPPGPLKLNPPGRSSPVRPPCSA